jgi:tetratricopeptide (TPR) repeat protein
VQWTLDSLATPGRELFVRLGVFAGPAALADIEIIGGEDGLDVVDALSALLDVALVRRVELGDSRVRFVLPEALRQIASAMLDESPDGARWREAHMRRQYEVLRETRARIGTATADRAARDADLEAAAALNWALEAGDPHSPWITAMRAAFIGRRGRLREGQALLEPLLASRPEDRELRAYVHMAHAWLLLEAAQIDEAMRAADSALALTSDPYVQGAALKARGALWQRAGRFDKAIGDHERFTSLARRLGPAELANALITESQSRMDAGELERGAALLAEAERIGPASDALGIWPAHSIRADLALLSGRPLEAAGHYARSLEIAQQRRDELQVRLDLVGIADALAASGRDADALEVAGIAEAHSDELGIDRGTEWHVAGQDHIREAAERLGITAAECALARGRAVPAGRRVLHAASLAGDPQLQPS